MPIIYINPARRSRRRRPLDGEAYYLSRQRAPSAAVQKARRARAAASSRRAAELDRLYPVSLRGKKNLSRKRRGGRGRAVVLRRGKKPLYGAAAVAWRRKYSKKRTTSKAATRRRRKETGMPRKKLYGAALAAYNKKRGRGKVKRRRKARRVKSSVAANMRAANKRGHSYPIKRRRRKARRKASVRRRRKTAAAAPRRRRRRRKAAATAPRRRRRRRRKAASAPKRRRRRRKAAATAPRRRRRRRRSAAAAPKRRRRRRRAARRRTGGRRRRRRTGLKALARARRSIKYNRRRGTRVARSYIKRHRMRTNPAVLGEVMSAARAAVPVALSLYLTRFIVNKFGPRIPLVDRAGVAAKPIVAALAVAGAHFASRGGPLRKYRNALLLGTGINLVDTLISAFAPAEVKSAFGLGDSSLYDSSLGEYIDERGMSSMGEYIDEGGNTMLGEYVDDRGNMMLGDVNPEQLLDDVAAGSPLHSHQAGEDANYTGVFRGGFGGTLG